MSNQAERRGTTQVGYLKTGEIAISLSDGEKEIVAGLTVEQAKIVISQLQKMVDIADTLTITKTN